MRKREPFFRRVRLLRVRRHGILYEYDVFRPEPPFKMDDIDYGCGDDKEKPASE
jgi:hypothetical protein